MIAISQPTNQFATPSIAHTLAHPAIVTVHLVNQSPKVASLSGITLYVEPIGRPIIELLLTNNVGRSYENAVAQGIQQALAQLNAKITGLRIWWCDWHRHPIHSRSNAFTHAATRAVLELWPWLTLKNFVTDAERPPSTATLPLSKNAFNKGWAGKHQQLHSPIDSRWTMQTPLISHITQISDVQVLPTKINTLKQLFSSQTILHTTLSFKTIAYTQRVCPVDKLSNFHGENGEIFNTFANSIRRDLPNARGFDVLVQQLTYQTTSQPTERRTHCLKSLIYALQQAINVSCKY